MTRSLIARAVVVSALFALGCQSNVITPPPPGLEPLAENRAAWPEAEGDDPHPEKISVSEGYMDDGGVQAFARAFIHAPPAKVFASMKTPGVLVDRRQIDEWTVTMNVEPEYQVSFKTHNKAKRFITVEWDMLWRMGIVEGTEEDPESVFEVSRKVEGSSFVERAQHSIVLRKVDDNTSSLEIVVQGKGTGIDPETMAVSATDMFNSLVAHVNGREPPKL